MANRNPLRNWNDVQLLMATASVAITLGLWNLFAGPDRETAIQRAEEEASARAVEVQAEQAIAAPAVEAAPQQTQDGVLLLGGAAPQTQIVVQASGGRGGGGGGGGATSTRSS